MFAGREDAARQLAGKLRSLQLQDPIVLAIPRGGVVTGAVLAEELDADLDVVLARKLRAPFQPELALGAVGEDGEVYINQRLAAAVSIDRTYVAEESRRLVAEIKQRQHLFRAGRGLALLTGRSVILTDDGIATGATMIAAMRVVQAHKPRELIVAVPVAPRRKAHEFEGLCDRFVCLLTPVDFMAVGEFYRSFETVEDDDVARLLQAASAKRQVV